MNSEPAEEPQTTDSAAPPDTGKLPVSERTAPVEVPVFSCLVYISTDADGTVNARVANLAGIAVTAADERACLRQIVSQFKQAMQLAHESGQPIPWLTPTPEAPQGAATRLIPVHL